ncbi:MAG: hypothetical protein ACFFAE_02130 [Candidatus Hodarchaeota archaeon]
MKEIRETGVNKMKVAEKSIDSITRLKLKSGTAIEIHMITQDEDINRLIIEKGDESLSLNQEEISDFISLFNDFLENM